VLQVLDYNVDVDFWYRDIVHVFTTMLCLKEEEIEGHLHINEPYNGHYEQYLIIE